MISYRPYNINKDILIALSDVGFDIEDTDYDVLNDVTTIITSKHLSDLEIVMIQQMIDEIDQGNYRIKSSYNR